jgi:ketohexokinase
MATLFCTRGVAGAVAMDPQGRLIEQAASLPPRVVDTLGAGDTFNAAVINGCLAGLDMDTTLQQACRLAGRKCGQSGVMDLLAAHDSPT